MTKIQSESPGAIDSGRRDFLQHASVGLVALATAPYLGTSADAASLAQDQVNSAFQSVVDREYQMMRVLTGAIDPQGHIRYVPMLTETIDPIGRQTRYTAAEHVADTRGVAFPTVNSIVLLAMDNWQQRDGNAAWNEPMGRISEGLQRAVVRVEDRAYFPLECGYAADGTWRVLRHGHLLPYTAPEEPVFDQQGAEGAVKIQNIRQMAALLKHYQQTGDQGALDVARRLGRFVMKPSMWVDTADQGIAGHEHGIFEGHFHGTIYTLHMLANLAAVDNDASLWRFIREGYHQAQRFGAMAMGWFPAWTHPPPGSPWASGRPPALHNTRAEGCGVSDMLMLAVKLSDAGMGDYWDDVDHIIRNQLAEQQFVSLDLMRACAGGDTKHDPLLARFVGGFGSAQPTANLPRVAGCCTANCAVGMYYAWHGITRFDEGVATVNLFLNRASTWMDVDSYLPFEGKVVLHNKLAHTARVRLPTWLSRSAVTTTINGRAARPAIAGSFMLLQGLKPGDTIALSFRVSESVAEYTLGGVRYRLSFRGSTVVDISPRTQEDGMYPIFLRDHMKATTAPLMRVKRFVPRRILPLQ